jgi:hypothetical protein
MAFIKTTITEQGIASANNAGLAGIKLKLTQIAYGSGAWTTGEDIYNATALKSEQIRKSFTGSQQLDDGTLKLSTIIVSNTNFDITEFGIFTDTGILFAIYVVYPPDIIGRQEANIEIRHDFYLNTNTCDAGSLEVIDDGSWIIPDATESTKGITRISTVAGIESGLDTNYLTIKNLLQASPTSNGIQQLADLLIQTGKFS